MWIINIYAGEGQSRILEHHTESTSSMTSESDGKLLRQMRHPQTMPLGVLQKVSGGGQHSQRRSQVERV